MAAVNGDLRRWVDPAHAPSAMLTPLSVLLLSFLVFDYGIFLLLAFSSHALCGRGENRTVPGGAALTILNRAKIRTATMRARFSRSRAPPRTHERMLLDTRNDVEKCGDGCFSAPLHCRRDRDPPCMTNTESSCVRAASSGRLSDVEQTRCPQLSLAMPRVCDSAAFNHTQHGLLLLWLRWSPKSARARERRPAQRWCSWLPWHATASG